MASLLSKLSGTSKSAPIEPREIFMTLPKKTRDMSIPEMSNPKYGKSGLMLETIRIVS